MTLLNINGSAYPQMPATSGTYNFSVTRDDIIREALLNLGVLEESEVPTAQETFDCARKLNLINKQLAAGRDKAPGFKMWQRERGDLFMTTTDYCYDLGATGDRWAGYTADVQRPTTYNRTNLVTGGGVGSTSLVLESLSAVHIGDYIGVLCGSDYYWDTIATMDTVNLIVTLTTTTGLPLGAANGSVVFNYTNNAQRPAEILTCLLRDINGTDTPLDIMTLQTYEALPTKIEPGFNQDPTAFYYEPRVANLSGRFFIDCAGAQDVTKTLHMVYLRENQDFDNPGDAPEYPQEWFNALVWYLTLACHSMFDVDWTAGMDKAYNLAISPARESNPEISQAYFQTESEDGSW